MESKKVSVKIKSSNFPDTGIPFKLKRVAPNKGDSEFKKEYEDFMSLCNSMDTSVFNSYRGFSVTDSEIDLELDVIKGTPRTFTFLGMSITEDLDVVIKGSNCCVSIQNLYNPKLFYARLSSVVTDKIVDDIPLDHVDNIIKGITQDNLRVAIESLKLENMFSMDASYSSAGVEKYISDIASMDSTKTLNFLDGIIKDIVEVKESLYSSVILNFVNEDTTVKSTLTLDTNYIKKLLYLGILDIFSLVIEKYKNVSKLLSTLDIFLSLMKKKYGREFVIKQIKDGIATGEYGDIGCFEGFAKDNSITGRDTQCSVAYDFLTNSAQLFKKNVATFTYPMEVYMTSMFDVPNKVDITQFSREDCLAYSVLDTLKYVDTELELAPKMYDMDNTDERDTYLKNVISGYKKKFNTFWKGTTIGDNANFDIDDSIIEKVLPIKQDSIDILGITKSIDADTDTDIEVSRVSFNTTNLMNVCVLVDRMLKLLIKKF